MPPLEAAARMILTLLVLALTPYVLTVTAIIVLWVDQWWVQMKR